MSAIDDPILDAIESRLASRAGLRTPPGHRDRVLAAVRDTRAERPGGPPRTGSGIDAGGSAALVALALSAMVAVVMPWLALARPVDLLPMEPRIVIQARAAGIKLPVALAKATPEPARELRSDADGLRVRLYDAWRLQNLLTGEL